MKSVSWSTRGSAVRLALALCSAAAMSAVLILTMTAHPEARQAQAARLANLSYDEILTTKVAFGTAPSLIERLTALKDELRLSGIAAELNPGGLLPFEQEMRSLQIMTQQVMPAFK